MSYVMLCKTDDNGNEIFLGFFESEAKLLEAIPETPKLKVECGKIVLDPGTDLSKYTVRPVPINTIRDDLGVIDMPEISVTVNSFTDPNTVYGVSIRDGKIVACSCPAFQYAKTDGGCKHMDNVQAYPAHYGIGLDMNGRYRKVAPQTGNLFPEKLYGPTVSALNRVWEV